MSAIVFLVGVLFVMSGCATLYGDKIAAHVPRARRTPQQGQRELVVGAVLVLVSVAVMVLR